MSTQLYDMGNKIMGHTPAVAGLFYYSNWAVGATAGAGATHALTINKKIEGEPPVFPDDPDTDFPGLFISRMGWPSITGIDGKQYSVTYTARLFYVAETTVGKRAQEVAYEAICKVVDNIMAADKIGLTDIITVDWGGISQDDELGKIISVLTNGQYNTASALLNIDAEVNF